MIVFITCVCCHSNFQTVYRRTRHKPSFSVKFENENDVTCTKCNKYEQIMLSCLLSVLEYNIHLT